MARDSLAGLKVPSIEELVRNAVRSLGPAYLDLAKPMVRQRLVNALLVTLGSELRQLSRTFEQACSKACRHVEALMQDQDYQEKRVARQKTAAANRQKRRLERAAEQKIASEALRQNNKGLVQ